MIIQLSPTYTVHYEEAERALATTRRYPIPFMEAPKKDRTSPFFHSIILIVYEDDGPAIPPASQWVPTQDNFVLKASAGRFVDVPPDLNASIINTAIEEN